MAEPRGVEIVGDCGEVFVRYRLICGERQEDVEVEGWEPSGESLFLVGKRPYSVRCTRISDSLLLLRTKGRTFKAAVASLGSARHIFLDGRAYSFEESGPAPSRRRSGSGRDEQVKDITPPMPSVVVKIMVREEDMVVKGQALMVVSAMKMETTLKAPYSGIVKKINTSVNARVAPGDILVEIAEAEKDHE
jgi:3-methylcrotonyl-CoA carboxylase alpha subunit